MKTYGWTPEHIRHGMTSAQGWASLAAAMQMDYTAMGASWQLKGLGYIGQARKRILDS